MSAAGTAAVPEINGIAAIGGTVAAATADTGAARADAAPTLAVDWAVAARAMATAAENTSCGGGLERRAADVTLAATVTAAVAAVLVAVALVLATAIHEEALVVDAAGDRNGDAPRAKNERASGDPTDASAATSNVDVANDGNDDSDGNDDDEDDDDDDDTDDDDDNGAARNVPATCGIHGLPSADAAAEAEWRSSGICLTRTGEADGSKRAPMPAHGFCWWRLWV